MKFGAPRTRSRRAAGLAAAVLTLGLGGGVAAAASLAVAADDARDAQLRLRAAAVRGALGSALQRYNDTTHDLVAVATTPAVTDAVDRITDVRLPGAHRVLVIDADRKVLAQHTADSSTPPATDRLNPEPELDRAMALTEKYGQAVATPAHVLPDDAGLPLREQHPGFVLVAPVRDGAFRGWVIISVRATDLLSAAMRVGGVTGVAVKLTETTPDGAVRTVAAWSPDGATQGDEAGRIDLPIDGQAWHLEVRPTTPLVGFGRQMVAPATMAGAVLLSVTLAGLVLIAAGDRRKLAPAAGPGTSAAALPGSAPAAGLALPAPVAASLPRVQAPVAASPAGVSAVVESALAGFAANAGNQLQAPLHSITGYAEMLLEEAGPALDDESRGMLHRIDGAARRVLTVVDELIAYASAGDTALKPEPIEASMLALDVAAAHLPGPGIEIGELPAIAGDTVLLRQVLDQMVGNAARFVRQGTPARIGIGARELPGGWWRIEVTDRGIGVPEDQRSQVFAPFHRAPAAKGYPGSGLGLAVCARIVALHNGEIGVESNPGGGSVFWFTVAGAEIGTREPVLTPH